MTNKSSNAEKKTAKFYDTASIKSLDKSQVEISVSIPTEAWEKFRNEALKNINESVTVDGFRKGMIPENILISKVGESAIIQEMAELAISRAYIEILTDKKIDAIGKPQIQLTKLAKGNPLELKIITAVVPQVTLPDYKKISLEEIKKNSDDKINVEEKEIDEAILKIRKSRASHEGHDHEKMTAEEHEKAIMDSLPELNDEFVKSLGDFKDMKDFREKVKEIISQDKKDKAREKLRIKIADAISDATKIDLPEIMVESEVDRAQAQFEDDIERMGVKLEDYLKHAKKTIEEIRKEWLPHAERKVKLQLILNAISDAENIKPKPEEIENEVKYITENYKEADKERASVYAETVLTNEKIFQFLEQDNTKK